MDRRQFRSAATASLVSEVEFARDKPRRVGLIGCGWYGADLFRWVQVAPVEIVPLCDVDKAMLAVVEAQHVVNDDEANRLLGRPYRKPCVHPEPERV